MNTNFDPAGRQTQNPLARVLTVVLGLLALAAAFMFSIVIFAAVAIVGLVAWLYFLWKTRALREHIRAQMRAQDDAPKPAQAAPSGEVIEGESVRVVDERNRIGE